jgi:hypothetical protein
MELGSRGGGRYKLSPEEKQRRRDYNLCLTIHLNFVIFSVTEEEISDLYLRIPLKYLKLQIDMTSPS